MRFPARVGVALALLLGGCVAPPAAHPGPTDVPLRFELPRVVDATRGGFEPSLAFGPDFMVVCSMRGVGAGTDLWRSLDQGATFEYVGVEVAPGLPVVRSGPGDLGGGDCDVAVDAGGTAYMVDLWGGGVSVVRSNDRGASWTGRPVSVAKAPLDRPWALGGDAGEVFVVVNQPGSDVGGIWVARSTDGGATFPQQAMAVPNTDRVGLHSNLVRGGDRVFFAFWREEGNRMQYSIAFSDDRGVTWSEVAGPEQHIEGGVCRGPVVFPVLAAFGELHLALVWTAQVLGTERVELFVAFTEDGGETWTPPQPISTLPGTRAFPWAAAGPDGELGVVWYETDASATLAASPVGVVCGWQGADGATWSLRYASVRRSDGGAAARIALVDPEPVHVGPLDRPYAERIQVVFDAQDRANIVYVADRDGGPRVVFARER